MTTVNIPLLLFSLAIPIAIYFITKLIMKNKAGGKNKKPLIFALISLVPVIMLMLFTGLIFGVEDSGIEGISLNRLLLFIIIPTATFIITKQIIKKKENANKKLPIITALISIFLMAGIITAANSIGQQFVINRISGVWSRPAETIDLQRRDNRVYEIFGDDPVFVGNWSLNGNQLTFHFLDDTTERFWVRFENNNNTLILSGTVDGQQVNNRYQRLE